ncbi:MAG: hypothetical protein Q8L53_00465 [Aestuariivirga sp.]|nr:hypothetical protein [Aestuariivirga sp.]
MSKPLRLSIVLAAMLIATPAIAIPINVLVSQDLHYQSGTVNAPSGLVAIPEGPDAASPVLNLLSGTILYIDPPPGSPSVGGQYRSPWQYTEDGLGNPYEPDGAYTSVQANSSGEIFYGLGAEKTGLAIAWGSPDSYNWIRFFFEDNEVASLSGSDVGGQAYGINFVILSLLNGFVYDTVRFYSIGQNAFEFSNVRAFPNSSEPVVPLPAGLILLLSGLAGLGFLGRARAKSA